MTAADPAILPSLDPRTEAVYEEIIARRHRFRRAADAAARPGEIEITSDWSLRLLAPETPLTRQMQERFRCRTLPGFGVTPAEEGGGPAIEWQLEPSPLPLDPQNPECEAFTLEVTPERILLRARHERGLLHGTHRLEWTLANRGGPFLPPGTSHHQPAFMPRLSNGVFIPGSQKLTQIGHFPDEYLALMSYYGVNGLHLYVNLWHLFRSSSLPEIEADHYEQDIAALRLFSKRAAAYGIDLYLLLNTGPLDADHPLFAAHPDVRGSKVEIFIEEISGRNWYNVCSGSGKVRAAYAEALETIFNDAPEVAGGIMIIGGECIYHCFTRPADSARGETNCPHCRGRSPSREIATLVNTCARAVKRTGAQKALYAWPYSAFVWSVNDPHQLGWIDHLDPEVSVLTNFDGGDALANGSGVRVFDYNIGEIGPSALFADQARHLRSKGRPIYTKVETDTTPDAFFLPCLPVYFRWHERAEAMRRTGVAGFIGQWRFYGMSGSIAEELQYRAIWESPEGRADEWLAEIARRDLQLSEESARRVLEGWRHLSRAWDHYPYSAMTSGERAAYMRGPFYLGPSHPLIFDVQDHYQLPLSFRLLRGDLTELSNDPETRAELQRNAKPRYVSDLLTTLPYGVERYLELVAACRAEWETGRAILQKELEGRGGLAEKELNLCHTVAAHLATLENTIRFYAERDRLQGTPCTAEQFSAGISRLQAILTEEMEQAEAFLPILESDPRLGYGHCYRPVYDAEMVRAKLEQCRKVRDVELPRFASVVRFHVWLE